MNKTIECALGLFAFLAFAGCYNTNNLKNGGLVCGSGGTCPSGYVCDGQSGAAGHCWKKGTVPDAGGVVPGQGCTTAEATPPYGPFAACNLNLPIPNSTCDPICQAGCPCNHRCVLDDQTNTSFTCEASVPGAGTTFVQPLGACNPPNTGLCAPGSACIYDGLCQNLCYKVCQQDDDCGDKSRCTASGIWDSNNNPVPNVNFCSPPIETCNPTGSASCATARANYNCVFLAGLTNVANSDLTVCDCSTLHSVAVGKDCSLNPDKCQPGSACVNSKCHSLCALRGTSSGCPSGSTCTAIYGSQTYGYCK
ncbi:MAG TPA: hypothetical protein VF550_15235 [Polyangia bacterium]